MKIPIQQIGLVFQHPDCLDEETVERYAAVLRSGGTNPPVHVYFDGQQYWLADGFHRLQAGLLVGIKDIDVEVTQGTYSDLEEEWQRYLAALRENFRRSV